ncbi:MAG TPA: hypothetical protein VGC22_14345 [Chitinophaga sp.]
MFSSDEFLTPRLTGKRFEDHSIPLDLLEDFAALDELLIEVAKWVYLKENPDRKRVPRGFTNGISLKLSSIAEGSAIPKILLVASSVGIFPNQNLHYFEKAKENILSSMYAAEQNGDIIKFIPENLLGYFNRIGKRLKDDEAIDFSYNSPINIPAKLTKNSRKKLILASSKITEFTSEATVRGLIPEVDKAKKTFTILTTNGQKIMAKIEEQHLETIQEAFNKYESKCLVLISGLGRFNQQDKLEEMEFIEHISILDPLDIPTRIEELAKLEDGWLNGEGVAPARQGLQWFSDIFENNYEPTLPLPLLYPTIEGGIQAEWASSKWDITLTINLNDYTGFYHCLNLNSDKTEEYEFDLKQLENWQLLNQKLNTTLKA